MTTNDNAPVVVTDDEIKLICVREILFDLNCHPEATLAIRKLVGQAFAVIDGDDEETAA